MQRHGTNETIFPSARWLLVPIPTYVDSSSPTNLGNFETTLIDFKLKTKIKQVDLKSQQQLYGFIQNHSKIQLSITSPSFWNSSTSVFCHTTELHPSNHRNARRSQHAVAALRSYSVAVSNGFGENEHHQSNEGHDPATMGALWGRRRDVGEFDGKWW